MSDLADLAQSKIEMHAAAGLRYRQPEGPEATGVCLWCSEPLPSGKRWCDTDCRDDWERDQRARRMNRG